MKRHDVNVSIGTKEMPVTTVQKVKTVTLVMTYEDAQILKKICCNVGGIPSGPRGVADNIYSALNRASVEDIKGVEVQAPLYFRE